MAPSREEMEVWLRNGCPMPPPWDEPSEDSVPSLPEDISFRFESRIASCVHCGKPFARDKEGKLLFCPKCLAEIEAKKTKKAPGCSCGGLPDWTGRCTSCGATVFKREMRTGALPKLKCAECGSLVLEGDLDEEALCFACHCKKRAGEKVKIKKPKKKVIKWKDPLAAPPAVFHRITCFRCGQEFHDKDPDALLCIACESKGGYDPHTGAAFVHCRQCGELIRFNFEKTRETGKGSITSFAYPWDKNTSISCPHCSFRFRLGDGDARITGIKESPPPPTSTSEDL